MFSTTGHQKKNRKINTNNNVFFSFVCVYVSNCLFHSRLFYDYFSSNCKVCPAEVVVNFLMEFLWSKMKLTKGSGTEKH